MASRLFCLAGSAGLKSWRRGRGGLEAGLWLSQRSPRPSVSAVTFRRPLLAGVSVLSKPHLDLHTGQAWVYGPIQRYGGGKGSLGLCSLPPALPEKKQKRRQPGQAQNAMGRLGVLTPALRSPCSCKRGLLEGLQAGVERVAGTKEGPLCSRRALQARICGPGARLPPLPPRPALLVMRDAGGGASE